MAEKPNVKIYLDLVKYNDVLTDKFAMLLNTRVRKFAKAIVASGSSNDPCVVDFKSYGFRGAIVKPFQVMELGTLIHGILANSE